MAIAILNLAGGEISGGHERSLLNILPCLAASSEIAAVLYTFPVAMSGDDWLPQVPKAAYVVCGG